MEEDTSTDKIYKKERTGIDETQFNSITAIEDPQERIYEHCKWVLQRKHTHKVPHCMSCWLPMPPVPPSCVCDKLQVIGKLKTNIKFIVFMHFKEYFRSSNTAKIFRNAAPESCEILIYGKKEDEDRLLEIVKSDPTHTFVLFPSTDSVSVEEYLSKSDEGNKGPYERKTLTAIVLDGTWGNAATMMRHCNKLIPSHLEIPKVRLNPDFLSSFTRTQSQADRICTLESMVLLMKELGEPEETQKIMLDNMKDNIQYMNWKDRGKKVKFQVPDHMKQKGQK